jgi:ZIP family zinc transporter
MGAALGWGVVAASSLVLGALLGLLRTWPERLIGLVLAFGAGALISSVRFELFEDGIRVGGAAAVGIGLAAGALLVMLVDSMIPKRPRNRAGSPGWRRPLASRSRPVCQRPRPSLRWTRRQEPV